MHTTSALPRYSMYQKMRTKPPKICQRSTWTLARKIGRCHSLAMSQHLDAYVLFAHWTWPVVHPVVPLVFWTEARLTVPIPLGITWHFRFEIRRLSCVAPFRAKSPWARGRSGNYTAHKAHTAHELLCHAVCHAVCHVWVRCVGCPSVRLNLVHGPHGK